MAGTDKGGSDSIPSTAQRIFRRLLGGFLLVAGFAHFARRSEFLAQVPEWVPLDGDLLVVLSGIVELVLGAALIVLPRYRVLLGWIAAVFFVVVFPGNVAQFVNGTDAFGLDSDASRAIRLLFQPVLVVWALWSTGAWGAWRERRSRGTVGTDARD